MTAGLSIRFGGRGSRSPRPAGPTDTGAAARRGVPGRRAPACRCPSERLPRARLRPLRDAVVATASEAMGRPYEWGGTGADGGGFDCSGLIQHAYGSTASRCRGPARIRRGKGARSRRKVGSLAPGDLLTFSNRGGRVTHVGLYIGEGRFIHSASRGVQVSMLSGEDPYGRWWYKRWVGARRIVRGLSQPHPRVKRGTFSAVIDDRARGPSLRSGRGVSVPAVLARRSDGRPWPPCFACRSPRPYLSPAARPGRAGSPDSTGRSWATCPCRRGRRGPTMCAIAPLDERLAGGIVVHCPRPGTGDCP